MIWQIYQGVGQARYEEVKIIDQGTIARIEERRNLGGSRLLHNKVSYFVQVFLKNYISHFSLKYMALEGGSHYQFSLPGRGLINPLNYLLLIVGIVFVVWSKQINHRIKFLLLGLMLIAPIPSSLTREAPHVLRSITFLPVPMIFSAIGVLPDIDD